MKEYKLYLNGLNCANCGNKIEKKVNSLKEVQEAVLNFSVGTLTIELKNEDIDLDRRIIIINNGKGNVSRIVPISEMMKKRSQKKLKK